VKFCIAVLCATLSLGIATAAPSVADPTADADHVFFDYLHRRGERTDTTRELKNLAFSICDGMDAGMTFEDVGMTLMDGGASSREAAVQIFASVKAYCPWNHYLLD
jgi:sugar (pentulose or hexulose) kinase